jgi:hypothetical protein
MPGVGKDVKLEIRPRNFGLEEMGTRGVRVMCISGHEDVWVAITFGCGIFSGRQLEKTLNELT